MILLGYIAIMLVAFALLWKGGDFLTDSSVSLAHRFHIPELLIGLTLVAFGTSLPELFVNVIASMADQPDIVFGNIIGSNISNILLVLGVTASISPVLFTRTATRQDLPIAVFVALLFVLILNLGSADNIDFLKATLLLAVFFSYLIYLYIYQNATKHYQDEPAQLRKPLLKITGMFCLGLIFLILGGRFTIYSVTHIAQLMGISEALIALFAIAIGTSLPELTISTVSTLKGKGDLAVGNIIGSSVFNLLLIVGASGLISTLEFPNFLYFDLWTMIGAHVLLILVLFLPPSHKLSRYKGLGFLGLYLAYSIFIFYRG